MKVKTKEAKRKISMKAKRKRTVAILIIIFAIIVIFISKGNEIKCIGYTYDTGKTVWDIAEKYCPNSMDIRDLVREIEDLNEIKDHIVYEDMVYQIPIYE